MKKEKNTHKEQAARSRLTSPIQKQSQSETCLSKIQLEKQVIQLRAKVIEQEEYIECLQNRLQSAHSSLSKRASELQATASIIQSNNEFFNRCRRVLVSVISQQNKEKKVEFLTENN